MSHDLIAIRGAGFGPDQLKTMAEAFDRAWEVMGPHFERDGHQAQHYRERLADAIVALATIDGLDVEELKNAALQTVALEYRKKA